jgi:hypothetical protein
MKTEESTGDDSSSEAEPEVMGKQGLDKAEDNVDESPSSGENEHEKVGSKHKPTKTKRNTSSSSTSNKVKPKIDTNLKSGKAQPSDTKTTADKGAKTESPQPDAGAVRVTKRRRTSDSGAAVAVATTHTPNEDGLQGDAKVKHEANGRSNTSERFKRVDPVKFKAHVVGENRYDAKVRPSPDPVVFGMTQGKQDAPNNDYGKRAHQDLIVTRGAGFRKEKNKKKRGSYRGGEITVRTAGSRMQCSAERSPCSDGESQFQVCRLDPRGRLPLAIAVLPVPTNMSPFKRIANAGPHRFVHADLCGWQDARGNLGGAWTRSLAS